jgi:hypothetical protein
MPEHTDPAPARRPAATGRRIPRKITPARVRRLVDGIVGVIECTECPPELHRLLDQALIAIEPFYERKEPRR